MCYGMQALDKDKVLWMASAASLIKQEQITQTMYYPVWNFLLQI